MTLVMVTQNPEHRRGAAPDDDGTTVQLAALRSTDLPGVVALLRRCSRASLFHRFHGFSDGVAWAGQLLQPGVSSLVMGAWSGGRCVGIANLAGSSADVLELGLLVEDEWQRRGVGRALVSELLERAKAEHVKMVRAVVLPEDAFALRMLRPFGSLHAHFDGGVYSADVNLSLLGAHRVRIAGELPGPDVPAMVNGGRTLRP